MGSPAVPTRGAPRLILSPPPPLRIFHNGTIPLFLALSKLEINNPASIPDITNSVTSSPCHRIPPLSMETNTYWTQVMFMVLDKVVYCLPYSPLYMLTSYSWSETERSWLLLELLFCWSTCRCWQFGNLDPLCICSQMDVDMPRVFASLHGLRFKPDETQLIKFSAHAIGSPTPPMQYQVPWSTSWLLQHSHSPWQYSFLWSQWLWRYTEQVQGHAK